MTTLQLNYCRAVESVGENWRNNFEARGSFDLDIRQEQEGAYFE